MPRSSGSGVGLVTGEERVNPDAPIICCTAEMAPMRGETLVLDEVQWAEDEERGSAWTRLMLGGEYRHILLLGAVEALPLVRHAFPQVEVRFFERKAPLDWVGKRGIAGLSPGTVVVAFSRRAVIGLAGELNQLHPGRVAVLYGAMPLASRREEIDRFIVRRRRGVRGDRRARSRRQPAVRDAALRRDGEVRRPASAAISSRGRSRRSRAAPVASASTSAATWACSPACRGRIPIRSSCERR